MEKLKGQQTRSSTMKNYLSIWRHFNNFLIRLDKRQPSWEENLVLFGTHLVELGSQSSTIKSYFSAIKHILKTDGYPWNDDKAMLSTITKSCKIINDQVKVRLPVSRKLLDVMIFELERILQSQPYLLSLYKALFMLAYYGLMRIGELTTGTHPMLAKDIHMGKNKDKILIMLRSSKTHGKESRPQKIRIETFDNANITYLNAWTRYHQPTKFKGIFCPFGIVRSFMRIRRNYLTDSEPFFIFQDRSPVAPYHVHTKLKQILDALNLDQTMYGMHSFCSGHACDMYKAGYSIPQIQKAGRWRLGAVYHYLKL